MHDIYLSLQTGGRCQGTSSLENCNRHVLGPNHSLLGIRLGKFLENSRSGTRVKTRYPATIQILSCSEWITTIHTTSYYNSVR